MGMYINSKVKRCHNLFHLHFEYNNSNSLFL
uniref:Uncharacterized protein n=1 Tax=Podoviridae sp. ctZkC8 TaxID=2825259 RepID=A0A8S5UC10_9CAUD|nr:MAG TPA: hypothetical protein [Podoviridae sp. ctZkC8]